MNAVAKPSFHLRGSVTAPAEIRDLQGWLIWRIETNEAGKALKVPYYANREKRNGKNGAPADRGKLVTFAAAVNAASRHGFDGIGLALMPEFNLTVLDFDHCVSGGQLDPEVAALVADTYAEFSPSGTGVHAIYRGAMPNKKSHANAQRWGFETFHSKGFVTFSGNVLDGCTLMGNEDTIAPISPEVRAEYSARFGQREKPEGTAPSAERVGLSLDEARQWLTKMDADIGYDDWLRAGMALHHEFGDEGFDLWDEWSSAGSKYAGSDSLMSHWRSFGRGDGPPITMRSVAKMAGVSPSTVADPEEFPDQAQMAAEEQAAPLKYEFKPLGVLRQGRTLSWIVKGVLPKAQLAALYGASGSGKTFFALDLAMSIARGLDWRGHRTKQTNVAYVVAEGADGFLMRASAYAQRHSIEDIDQVPMRAITSAPNLRDTKDVRELIRGINAFGGVGLVVVDTLAQTTPGANENASEDMSPAIANCQAIHAATGAMVLLVHHSGKDAARGMRGWSGMRGALDAEIEVSKGVGGRVAALTKSKDGIDGVEWGFDLEIVSLGVDEDGDPVTSCVVRGVDMNKVKAVGRKLGPVESVVNQAVQEMAKVQLAGIEVGAVIEAAVALMAPPEGRDTRKQVAKRALSKLLEDDAWPYELEEDGTISVL